MVKHAIVFIVVAGMLLVVPLVSMVLSSDFQYCKNNHGQYPSANPQSNQAATVLVPHPEPSSITFSCASSFTTENSGAITAWATIILTLVTAGLVLAGLEQFQTTRAQLRAYFIPHSVGIVLSQPNNVPKGQVEIKNFGQTPAYDVVTWAHVRVAEIVHEERVLVVPPVGKHFPFTIGPGGWTFKAFNHIRPLTTAEIEGIVAATHAIYVYGRVEYVDAFRRSHYSNFRYSISGVWPPTERPMLITENGNDSD